MVNWWTIMCRRSKNKLVDNDVLKARETKIKNMCRKVTAIESYLNQIAPKEKTEVERQTERP